MRPDKRSFKVLAALASAHIIEPGYPWRSFDDIRATANVPGDANIISALAPLVIAGYVERRNRSEYGVATREYAITADGLRVALGVLG